MIGIDLVGEHFLSTGFQCLDDDMPVAGSDLQQGPLRLSGKIKIGLCDLVNIEPDGSLPVEGWNEGVVSTGSGILGASFDIDGSPGGKNGTVFILQSYITYCTPILPVL